MCARHGVLFTGILDDDVPTMVRGDPVRFQQCLNNVVSNAGKFTGTGGSVQVKVEVAERWRGKRHDSIDGDVDFWDDGDGEGEGEMVMIRTLIKDTGIGMTPAQVASLFRPYAQATVSTVREYGGSGLGLAITDKIVKLMGGTIEVQTAVGKGSTFVFSVPFRVVEDGEVEVEGRGRTNDFFSKGVENRIDLGMLSGWDEEEVGTLTKFRPLENGIPSSAEAKMDGALKPAFTPQTIQGVSQLPTTIPPSQSQSQSHTDPPPIPSPSPTSSSTPTLFSPFTSTTSTPTLITPPQPLVILLVDDSKLNRQILSKMLTILLPSSQIYEAENGLISLSIARAHPPDIVFMDISMRLSVCFLFDMKHDLILSLV